MTYFIVMQDVQGCTAGVDIFLERERRDRVKPNFSQLKIRICQAEEVFKTNKQKE